MELCLIILKEEELLDVLIKTFTNDNIRNVTVYSSDSYVSEHGKSKKNVNIFGSIRYVLDYFHDESRVLLFPIKSERVIEVKEILKDLVPSHQYLLMVLPISSIEGTLES